MCLFTNNVIDNLWSCIAGAMADELQKQAAEETTSLRPAHTYVPWVTVNGIALGGAFEQLQIFICAAYLGNRWDTFVYTSAIQCHICIVYT